MPACVRPPVQLQVAGMLERFPTQLARVLSLLLEAWGLISPRGQFLRLRCLLIATKGLGVPQSFPLVLLGARHTNFLN